MSRPLAATLVLPFFGLLYREDLFSYNRILNVMEELASINKDLSFELKEADLRNYYEKEMGPADKLKRLWVFANQIMSREDLVSLKLKANALEINLIHKYDTTGRVLNIDPGYIALEQVLLSTNKPYGHRIFLSANIYAELTYQFQGGEFHELPWTYPDYREEHVRNHFSKARDFLKVLL